ncbi:MAG: tyrosine-type recombinase/integrase [Paracoccaceae bacterium]
MTRRRKGPVATALRGDLPARLRERERADGSWRAWWEAEAGIKRLGFTSVELDATAPMKAAREARKLNEQVDQARLTGSVPKSKRGQICIEDVIEDYKRSTRFTRLSPVTQRVYRSRLGQIIRKWGDTPAVDFTKPMADTWYEELARDTGPSAAVALIGTLSIVMDHAERRGHRPENSNPCLRLGITVPKGRSRAISWEEYDALQAAALRVGLPSVGLAVALSMLAGQRQTDILAALRGDFAEVDVTWPGSDTKATVWAWSLTRSKTGAAGEIMLHQELAPMVAAVLARPAPADARLIVEERVGRPYDADLFQKRWVEVRTAAADGGEGQAPCPSLAGVQFRDLRRSFAVHARRGGVSVDDAGDALGNSAARDVRIKGTYMPPEFFTAARAVAAVARPENPEERKEA